VVKCDKLNFNQVANGSKCTSLQHNSLFTVAEQCFYQERCTLSQTSIRLLNCLHQELPATHYIDNVFPALECWNWTRQL